MNNIELLKKYTEEKQKLVKQYDETKYNISDEEVKKLKRAIKEADFKKRIVLNNMYAIIVDIINREGYNIIKKYLKRNIGEKTLDKIRGEFNDLILPLTGYTIYIKHKYYTNCYENINQAKAFDFYCYSINLDTSYYIEGDTLKCKYNMEEVEIIEDVEEEAKRLTKLYYETGAKLKEIEQQMNKLYEDFNKNYHKNTYTDDISDFNKKLYFVAPYIN